MKTKSILVSLAPLAAAAFVASALAIQLPKKGTYDYTSCWSGVSNVIAFAKEYTAYSYEMTGTGRSNPPGGMFDMTTFRCVGLNSSLDKSNSGITVCEAIDRDGDRRLSYFSVASDGTVTRKSVAGTGKYDGMVTTTVVEPLGPFPTIKPGTFQNCNHQTGTYKLK